MTRVFIIASGPSLGGFDFHRLDNEVTIGLNYIYRYYVPTILHWIDAEVYNTNKKLIDGLDCIKIMTKVTRQAGWGITTGVYGIKESETFRGARGLTEGLYHKYLVGLTGLSLAVALGFKPIYLLGYDCCFQNGLGHFYSGDFQHKGDKREHVYTNAVARSRFAPFKDCPDIYNCSPISLIKEFPKVNIDEMLKRPIGIDKEGVRKEIINALQNTCGHPSGG